MQDTFLPAAFVLPASHLDPAAAGGLGLQVPATSFSTSVSLFVQLSVWNPQSAALCAFVHEALNLSLHFWILVGSGVRPFACALA